MNNKTLGEARVRTDFNVGKDGLVEQLKNKSAELINLVNSIPQKEGVDVGEFKRCVAKAMTELEDGAMWAVKAATF